MAAPCIVECPPVAPTNAPQILYLSHNMYICTYIYHNYVVEAHIVVLLHINSLLVTHERDLGR